MCPVLSSWRHCVRCKRAQAARALRLKPRPEMPRLLPDSCLPEDFAGGSSGLRFVLAAPWRRHCRTCPTTQLSFDQNTNGGIRPIHLWQKNLRPYDLPSHFWSKFLVAIHGKSRPWEGGGCFVATVLLTVAVNLLHYPLNPHLLEQKFTQAVFSIKFATDSQSNSEFCKCLLHFSTTNVCHFQKWESICIIESVRVIPRCAAISLGGLQLNI